MSEAAEAFAKEVTAVLESADVWEGKIGCLMCDFAATNWGKVQGVAVALASELEVPVVPAGCDLHLQNRALQNAVEAAFGTYKVGDVHVISMAYRVADLLDSDWPQYRPLLQTEVEKEPGYSGAKITKCPLPVVTRWWNVLLAAIWIEQHLNALKNLADYVYKFFPSKQFDLRDKWRAIHI